MQFADVKKVVSRKKNTRIESVRISVTGAGEGQTRTMTSPIKVNGIPLTEEEFKDLIYEIDVTFYWVDTKTLLHIKDEVYKIIP
jgi:hypothetical protein